MPILCKWSGDGLGAGVQISDSPLAAGPGETPFIPGFTPLPTTELSGPRPPRILISQPAASNAFIGWNQSKIGKVLDQCAVRIYAEFSQWASAAFTIISAWNPGGVMRWKLDIAGLGAGAAAGHIRLRDGNNVQYGSSTGVIPLNTVVRIEVTMTSTGTYGAYVYEGDDTEELFSVVRTGIPTPSFEIIRFGPVTTSPTVPTFWLDDLALSDEPVLIGPAVSSQPEPSDWTLWDGVEEVPLTLEGVWDGAQIYPLTVE